MIRGEIARHLDHDPHFQWRGESVTRIENLSDIVLILAVLTPFGPFAGFFMILQWPAAILIKRALPIDDTPEKLASST